MKPLLNEIVRNAQRGIGPCEGCPAHNDTEGKLINPGLLNPNAELMFLTMDPSHYTDWGKYETWTEYNDAKTPMFRDRAPGGTAIGKLLDGIRGVTVDDIWLADAIKCPANNDRAGDIDSDAAFSHCSMYLREEIEALAPSVIITMGNDPAEQLLQGIFDRDVGAIKAGTRDCGKVYETDPPVIISPHWANGWLGRHNNRQKVRTAIQESVGGL